MIAIKPESRESYLFEITGKSNKKGSFNLVIRRGDDTSRRKLILEQYNNLTLDPNDTCFSIRQK